MDESEPKSQAIERRDVLRKGALAGGGLVWGVPLIKSLNVALANVGSPGPGCCYCYYSETDVIVACFNNVATLHGFDTYDDCKAGCVEYRIQNHFADSIPAASTIFDPQCGPPPPPPPWGGTPCE